MSSLGVVHLVYKVQQALPVWYRLYTHSLIELFGSNFGEPYKFIQQVYEYSVNCRFLSTAC